MNKLDLNAYGVSEMNVAEMQKTDGGWFFGFGPFRIGVYLTRCAGGTFYRMYGHLLCGTPIKA